MKNENYTNEKREKFNFAFIVVHRDYSILWKKYNFIITERM